jgi:hypothetical protein
MGFECSGFKRFGQALKAGLVHGSGRRVAHGWGLLKKKNGTSADAAQDDQSPKG